MRLHLLAATALCGCVEAPGPGTVAANFQFSNASGLGTQNAGLYEPGSLFVWNIETNALTFVDTLELEPAASAAPGNVASRGVSGIALEGLPASLMGQAGLIEASIAAQAGYAVEGAVREDYRGTITAVAQYVRELRDAGADPDLVFRPRDDRFRVLVVRSVVRAEEAVLLFGGAAPGGGLVEVGLSSVLGDVASVGVAVDTQTSCGRSGDGRLPACFFNVIVLDPEYSDGDPPLLQFRTGEPAPLDALPDAFRALR